MTHEFAMQLFGDRFPAGDGVFELFVKPKMFTIDSYSPCFGYSVPSDAFTSACIVSSTLYVTTVLTNGGLANFLPSIIATIAFFVIYLRRWPFASHVEMSKAMRSIEAPFNPDHDIAFADRSGDLAYVPRINRFLPSRDGVFKLIEQAKISFFASAESRAPFSVRMTVNAYMAACIGFLGGIVATFSPAPNAGFRIVMKDLFEVVLGDRFSLSQRSAPSDLWLEAAWSCQGPCASILSQ